MARVVEIGDLLDSKYRIMQWLGGGGFGDVYLAEDAAVRRYVAIKALKDRDPERRADLIHEMQSLDQLRHPKVVTFYHHFVEDEQLFLVMEYCAGGSLRHRMQRGRIQKGEALQLIREAAETLRPDLRGNGTSPRPYHLQV